MSSTGDISISKGTVSLKVLGKSGNFQITNGTNRILFTLDRLQEVDATGKLIQSVNPHIFKTALNWGSPTPDTLIPGSTVTSTMIQLNSTFTLDKPGKGKPGSTQTTTGTNISFALTVYIAEGSGSYTFADSSFPIKENDIKYTISVSNWPFASSANMLQFGLAMETNATGTKSVKTLADTKSASVAVDGAVISSPLLAIIDDQITNRVLTSTYGSGTGIQFSFPSFTKSLIYDPTVDTSGSTDTSSYTTPTVDSNGSTVVGGDKSLVTPETHVGSSKFSVSYTFLIIALLALIAFYFYRYKT